MSKELLDTLYNKFGNTEEGIKKFLKHTKLLIEDGDLEESDVKEYLKSKNFTKIAPDTTKQKPKVKTWDEMFGDTSDDLFKKRSRTTNSSSSGCGSSSYSRSSC